MIEHNFKGIDKWSFYRAITGHDRMQDSPITSNDVVSIDVRTESLMDAAYVLVKKMERNYKANPALGPYYGSAFRELDEAYMTGNPSEFKSALEHLAQSILWD